ncbi:hypothetical protein [Photobacterium damselae]|uniref:Uncharacterized protein n=2 Tax=Photobacterium damselae TaxID=38293 RepID=D0YW30_PHODD|nr:hypothetical protein [Photobacterium damselae]EEZ40268.1 hypothetical protein VDA_001293 [Photobacterium damselae subsp. damselae CIP 102761]PSW86174.1 hypothetical protein CTN07_05585 [Photobacterium damselae]SPY29167.1 Uncharacterised protein [Photobacterium damselae]
MKKHQSKVLSQNHNATKKRAATLEQVKLRISLLNDFIENGVPDGFTAHTGLLKLLAYSDGGEIEQRSYQSILSKKNIPIIDIDPSFKGSASAVIDCKDYLLLKIDKLKKLEMPCVPLEQSNDAAFDSSLNTPKTKTKGELKGTIKEQAALIESLAKELLKQRRANNTLISVIRERDRHASRTLKAYFDKHQDDLCQVREFIKPSLEKTISNLHELSREFDEAFGDNEDSIVQILGER